MSIKSKFHIGDKVRVREDLRLYIDYGMTYDTATYSVANNNMKHYRGKIVTIVDFSEEEKLIIEGSYYTWTDEMFTDDVNRIEDEKIGEEVLSVTNIDLALRQISNALTTNSRYSSYSSIERNISLYRTLSDTARGRSSERFRVI